MNTVLDILQTRRPLQTGPQDLFWGPFNSTIQWLPGNLLQGLSGLELTIPPNAEVQINTSDVHSVKC